MEDFDVAPNGSIVAVGFSESDGGRTQFLAIIPKSGPTRIVRTTPYWPLLVSVAPDGSIWTTTGSESVSDSSGNAVSDNKQANALRHFDSSGTLIGGAITNRQAKSAQAGFLVAGQDRIALYGPKGGKSQVYFEAPTDLTNLATYPGAPTADLPLEQVTGFALTDSGGVFVSTLVNDASHTHALYQLDKSGKTWNRIEFPQTVGQLLIGSSGESLIFRAKGTSVPTLTFFDFAAPARSDATGQQ